MNARSPSEFNFDTPPTTYGRYLVLRRCDATACRDYLEPGIAYFGDGKWHIGGVLGWQGPIPVMKVADWIEAPEQPHLGSTRTDADPAPLEYDL